jgi:hypothetical protein
MPALQVAAVVIVSKTNDKAVKHRLHSGLSMIGVK